MNLKVERFAVVFWIVSACATLAQCVTVPANLIINGDFAAGNTGFTSNYTAGSCSAPQTYSVTTNAHNCHGSWYGTDHTSGTGLFMAVNGATSSAPVVWSQTVPVVPGSTYVVSVWVCSVYTGSPASISVMINGVATCGAYGAPSTLSTWRQFSARWPSMNATSATIAIKDLNLAYGGNDFGLDDISFRSSAHPGTQDDFVLDTAVGGPVSCATAGDLKSATPGQVVAVQISSPSGALLASPVLIVVDVFATSCLPASPFGIPALYMGASAAIIDAGPLGATGITLSATVPTGLSGQSVLLQAVAVSASALNGSFAASDAHEIKM